MRPRDSAPKPHEPCYIFERELQSVQNASTEGAILVTEELKIDTGPQCRTHRDACESEASADIECGWCCSQCGTHMDACESETSADFESGRRCSQCGTHMNACESETSADIESGCRCSQCGTHMDASEGETSAEIESGCYCFQCGTHMDASEAETSADIESACRCSDYRFEEMVQCAEGHLYCFTCSRRRIEESTLGGSQASNSLPSMDTSGCEDSFPWSEVKRVLPETSLTS